MESSGSSGAFKIERDKTSGAEGFAVDSGHWSGRNASVGQEVLEHPAAGRHGPPQGTSSSLVCPTVLGDAQTLRSFIHSLLSAKVRKVK